MSVYGDMLGFFPELQDRYKTFRMSPKPVAGYSERFDEGNITGNLQFIKSGDIDFEGDTSVDVAHPTFFTRQQMKIDQYILDNDADDDAEKTMYRRVATKNWKKIGGFYMYVLEFVAGVDGRQETEESVDGGVSQYD